MVKPLAATSGTQPHCMWPVTEATHTSFYGQAKPEEKDLRGLADTLKINYSELEKELGPSFFPVRGGIGEMPPEGWCRALCRSDLQTRSSTAYTRRSCCTATPSKI